MPIKRVWLQTARRTLPRVRRTNIIGRLRRQQPLSRVVGVGNNDQKNKPREQPPLQLLQSSGTENIRFSYPLIQSTFTFIIIMSPKKSQKQLWRTVLGLVCVLAIGSAQNYGQDPYGDYYGDQEGGWDDANYPGYQDYADDGYEDSLYEKYAARHQDKVAGGGG